MRVLYVIDSLAPGGTEQSTIVLAPHLRRLGVDATIVTLRAAKHDLTEQAESDGTPVRRLEASSFSGRIRELRRMVRSSDFDVVHTALFTSDQLGRVAAWGTGVPVISSFVSTPYGKSRLADPNVKEWKLRLVQTVDAITGRLMVDRFHAVSDGVKIANARSLHIPEDRVTVAERGRDAEVLGLRTAERRAMARSALDLSDDAEVVLNLGRLDHQKGQTVLVAAASELDQTHPNLVVLIAGKDGSASFDVRRLLSDDPVAASHVRLLGHRNDIGDLLCACDVLAISSHFEGTAGAAVEAMALSTPIVSTDLLGLGGVLDDGRNAVLVPVGDPGQLAIGIDAVLSDRVLAARIAAEGYRDFTDRFTLDAAAERLRDLYDSVVKPPH